MDGKSIKIFRRARQGFGRPMELSKEAGDVLATDLLAGFELTLGEIFE